jgi:hypothetical protein
LCACLKPVPGFLASHIVVFLWSISGCLIKKQDLVTIREHPSSPSVFFVGSVLLIFLVFVLSYYVSFCFWFRVVMSVTIFA